MPHIQSRNRAALEALITKPEVELKLLQRLRQKAELYALNVDADGERIANEVKLLVSVSAVKA